MGLFDFLKPKQNKILIDNYEQLRKETERLQNENATWQKEFDTIIKLREKAYSLEKAGRLNDAIQEYIKAVTFGEQNSRLNINNYAHDIERIIVLYGKTKQKENQIKFLNRVILNYPDYRDTEKWAVRLSKLTSEKLVNITELKPSDIRKQLGSNPTLGKQLQMYKDSLPKFNFYYDMPEGMKTLEYLSIRNPVLFEESAELRKYRESFKSIISKAKIAENEKNLKRAIEIYEKLVVEEYEGKEPYERLMILYRSMEWFEEEKRIIKHAISFFSQLKEMQIKNVICLAREYGMEDKTADYINEKRKIFYYGGAFELYNPFPIIKKWEKRLEKLNLKLTK
ncbi:hypothetical protein ES707_14110 [subsurface metagenome]